jgi:hypothetical protein
MSRCTRNLAHGYFKRVLVHFLLTPNLNFGLRQVESPIFQALPQLPSPLGTFVYTQFKLLPLVDRLTALPLMYAGDTLLCVYSWLPCSIMQPMVTFLSYAEIHRLLCSKHPTIPYPHIKPYHALIL